MGLVLNPDVQIEAGQSFAAIAEHGGWPVIVAMAEEFLGIRIDHVADIESTALGNVIDEIGPVPVCSRTDFSADGRDFVEGTNTLDGSSFTAFTTADPVDDAGQTRTRNLRALIPALRSAVDNEDLPESFRYLVPLGY